MFLMYRKLSDVSRNFISGFRKGRLFSCLVLATREGFLLLEKVFVKKGTAFCSVRNTDFMLPFSTLVAVRMRFLWCPTLIRGSATAVREL